MSIKDVPYNALTTPFNIENIILYPRKSREDEQREKETGEDCLAPMTEMLTNMCEKYHIAYSEDDIMPEIGSADTIDGRPVFKNIIYSLIPSGKYQAIGVREISRLGRGNFTDAGIIYDAIINYKVFIVTPHKIYDPNNKMDLKMLRWELFQAREEYETTKDRLWEYRDAKAKKGYAPNYIATLGIESIRGKIIIIPEEAELVRRIFEMRAEGMSCNEIAAGLNNEGRKTKRGTKYHNTTINRILKNRRYIGKSRWQGKEYEAQHPPVINMELWNNVREVEKMRAHNNSLQMDNAYWVELYCHECGNRMYGEMAIIKRRLKSGEYKRYNHYMIYVCKGYKKGCHCRHQERGDYVHQSILTELKKLISRENMFAALVKQRENKMTVNKDDLLERIKLNQKTLKQKETFLAKLHNDYATGDLSAALYSKHDEQTQREIESLNSEISRLKTLHQRTMIKTESPDIIKKKLATQIDNWDSIPNKKKKAIIKAFFPKISISKDKEFHIERKLPMSLDF